ncbi:hypothetical protein FA15DRAFT_719867 [Coprinopsis marcescibilis]|uniref:Uncharacterized protein n=1 Tax=Coprinopsis marcescibilis TaxID=230819 RepID=A0A5C3L5K8_COPMA|nr:hypothetical protein FA15DRAFT_719867 [Coprinopsis marcescibilis]
MPNENRDFEMGQNEANEDFDPEDGGSIDSNKDTGGWTEEDKIRVEYHPRSQLPSKVMTPDEYMDNIPTTIDFPPSDPEPWRPFQTWLDFEVASFIWDNHLNRPQQSHLLTLIRDTMETKGLLTLEDSQDLENIWTGARKSSSNSLSKHTITVPYKDEDIKFNVWARPIWDWVKELLGNRAIVSQFEWHAQKVYRENSDGTQSQMFTEPWMADSWWQTQSKLPEGGVPFSIILYADKTQLSSFGTKKGYPMYAQCGNLPAEVWNGKGVAGGRLVRWLPIVPEDANKSGTQRFADFKRVVWHDGFEKILESIVQHLCTGFFFQCGDNVMRQVFLLVMILSADYKEHKCTCPICLVPNEELDQLSKTYPLHTTEDMRKNVFWQLENVNIYDAISWDWLHDSKLEVKVDAELGRYPQWQGLTHFDNLAKMKEFSDGRKFEDLLKVLVFAMHSLFNGNRKSAGFLLLKLIRSYLMLDMYALLRCHTTETIKGAEHKLRLFQQLLKAYIKDGGSDKAWIFPKMHTQIHMIMDIIRKGVTQIPIPSQTKASMESNILKFQFEHKSIIRSQINELDCWTVLNSPSQVNNIEEPPVRIGTSHASVGSPAEGLFTMSNILHFCPEPLSNSETPHAIVLKVKALLCDELGHKVNLSIDSQHTQQEFWYAQLVCILGITIDKTLHLVAIVVPCDENPTVSDNAADHVSDRHLRLTHVRMQRGQNVTTAGVAALK